MKMLGAGRQTFLLLGLKNESEERGLLYKQSLETTLSLWVIWSAPDNTGLSIVFKKQRFLSVTKRLYLPILPVSSGLNFLALAAVHMYAVSFFKIYPLEVLQIHPDQIIKIFYENLVNLEEAYLSHRSIVIAYNSYSISFEEIRRASNIFFNNASAVACICWEVCIFFLYFSYYNNKHMLISDQLLKRLKYIHNKVGIIYRNLLCYIVVLTDKGQVKISKSCYFNEI